ncbi:hypothetical protein BDY24DRAFT_417100 [Mrakia frigida]|uniref:uncharacterized protein n=1 Tax=Mrakia frigida TaxID=29902 RepID=UPI003FCC1C16
MSRSNPPSRPGSSSSSRPQPSESSSSQQPDYTSAFGSGGVAYLKTRDVASAPTSRHSTPQPLHATPGVKIIQAKVKATHGGGGGAVVSDLLGGKAGAKAKESSNGKKPERRSEKAEALEVKIRDVESLVFDEAGGSSAATAVLGKRALKKGKGGCFCQARIHPLSTYTPLCPSCSLPLCVLQLPHLPCPSCFSSLLTPVSRSRLLATLTEELDSLLASEQRERDRLEEIRRENAWRESAGGKFPVLAAGIVKGTKDRAKAEDAPGRKVMSMNAKTGRFEVKTFVKKPRSEAVDDSDGGTASEGGPSRAPSPELFEGRIKAPRMEYPTKEERVEHVREVLGERQKERRFFLDVGGLELKYVEPRKVVVVEEETAGEKKGKGRKRGRGKGKGKEVEQEGEGSSSRLDGEDFVDEGPSQQHQTPSTLRGEAPDDLTAEERAWMGLPPLPTTTSRPPNPTTPAFIPSSSSSSNPKPNPTTSSPFYPPPPSPQRAPPLSQPTPQRRAAPPHLPASTKVSIPDSIQLSSSGLPSSQQSNGRYSVSHPPPSRLLEAGVNVLVIKKEDQGSGKTTFGEVSEVLTRGDHPSASPADVAEVEAYLTAAKQALDEAKGGAGGGSPSNTTANTTGISEEDEGGGKDHAAEEKKRKEGMSWGQRMGA